METVTSSNKKKKIENKDKCNLVYMLIYMVRNFRKHKINI